MKTLISVLMSASALTLGAFATSAPAAAQGYAYTDDDIDLDAYREYCRDPEYRARYAYFCNRFYDDDDDYDYDDAYDDDDDTSYYPYSGSAYPYSAYPYGYNYGPSIGLSFGFRDFDRGRRHWRGQRGDWRRH